MSRIRITHGGSSVELEVDRRTDLADLIAAATLPNDGPAPASGEEFGFALQQTPPHLELAPEDPDV